MLTRKIRLVYYIMVASIVVGLVLSIMRIP